MRARAAVILVFAACRGHGESKPAPAPVAKPSAPPAATGWARIEELADPAGERGGPELDLARAMAFAQTNHEAWTELRFRAPPPLASYADGAAALAALHAWSSAHGRLPALASPLEIGGHAVEMSYVGNLAIDTAADAAPTSSLADGLDLARVLVDQGRSFIEIQMGISLLERAQRRLAKLGQALDPSSLPATDLVRILAAEALSPSNDEWAALVQFWLAALDGAHRGEPAATTLARVTSAAAAASPLAAPATGAILSIITRMQTSLEGLRAAP